MTKHVSSGGEATSSSRDAATESLPIRESADAADAAAQHLPQGAVGAPGSDGNTAGNTDGSTDVKDTAGSAGSEAVRTEALAKDVTPDSAKGSGAAHSAAGSSTADTRLGGAWASPDAQNAATIGVVPSTSAAAKKARTKAGGPWYRRRAVVGAAGVALLAGSFGAGWGTNELLSSHSQHGQAQQQGAGNGQGMPGGGQGGPGGGRPRWSGRARWADARRRPRRTEWPGRPRWPERAERPGRSGRRLWWSRPDHPQRGRLQWLGLEWWPAVGLRLG